jgi:hypothetical protein
MLEHALDGGVQIDPIAHIPQLISQGQPDAAFRMAELARAGHPPGARAAWEELMEEMQSSMAQVRDAGNAVGNRRDEALEHIREHEEAVSEERERVERLVTDVAEFVHEGAAGRLAKEYADQAEQTEATAKRYTWASLLLGAATAGAAIATPLLFSLEAAASDRHSRRRL